MTNPTPHGQVPEALRLADWVESVVGGPHAKQCAAELRRQYAEIETLRTGYEAARLEIESLKAQLAESAKEHADELAVAYMCGASREKELAAQQPGAAYAALPEPDSYLFQHEDTGLTQYVDSQQVEWGFEKNNPRWKRCDGTFSASQMRAFADATCAMRAPHGQAPAPINLNCKTEQKRLATLWGFVPAQADPLQPVVALQEIAGMYADDFKPQADSVLEDAARLDWLEADESRCVFHLGKSWYTRPSYGLPYRKRASLREAIDDARKEMS